MSGWRGKKQRERERTRVGEDVATAQMQNVHADIKHTYMQDAAAASILRSLSSPGALRQLPARRTLDREPRLVATSFSGPSDSTI